MTLLVFGQTLGAAYAMTAVLPYHGNSLLELGMLGLFAILFAWISAGFWMALFGFVIRRLGGDRQGLLARIGTEGLSRQPLAPTALVFPIYHEEVARTFAGIRATYRDLERAGQLEHFQVFVLSDSRDPDVWLAEQGAWYRLCDELSAHGRLHYRRRTVNLKRKTGNIGDFLRRWGRHFRYMVVMDADSLMSGGTLVTMVRAMQAAPQVGILQSSPRIVNAASVYARIQQFANRLYGGLFTQGLAAVQMGDAAFWGHNAIIRVEAFTAHCGLRRLRGRGFLGGDVLSHDFVEAALMGRAGYEVWLEPQLEGSFEESPPTLVDELARDRRWAYGNLQHLRFLFAREIRVAHRFAFANGIMAYLASPLWFLFLALTTVEVARFTLLPVEYFPDPHALHPLWPEWNPQWALRLAFGTAFLLFVPKLLAYVDLLLDRPRLQAMGGAVRAFAGVLIEVLTSVLLAPLRMLAHSRFVLETLANFSVRWAGQNRTEEIGWRQALAQHAPGSLLAMAWAGFALWLKPLFFYWSLPVALPLVLAAPVSVMLSRFRFGTALMRLGLLLTPEAAAPPAVVRDVRYSGLQAGGPLTPFETAVLDPIRNRLHAKMARCRSDRLRRREALVARCLAEGAEALSLRERAWLAGDAESLLQLHRGAWSGSRSTAWTTALRRLCQS